MSISDIDAQLRRAIRGAPTLTPSPAQSRIAYSALRAFKRSVTAWAMSRTPGYSATR